MEIQAVTLPPEEFEQFRNFYKEIVKADDMKIALVKRNPEDKIKTNQKA